MWLGLMGAPQFPQILTTPISPDFRDFLSPIGGWNFRHLRISAGETGETGKTRPRNRDSFLMASGRYNGESDFLLWGVNWIRPDS